MIYKASKRLAIEVHAMSLELPKHEMYEEGGQVCRSSKSVTSMIVEGYGRRRYKAEYIRYLIFSQAESDETFVHLEFLFETGSARDVSKVTTLIKEYDALSKSINKYIQWVEESFDPDNTVHEPDPSYWEMTVSDKPS